jgi:hypothetical protein
MAEPEQHVSAILAMNVLRVLRDSGANRVEAFAALDAAQALIPVYIENITSLVDVPPDPLPRSS